MGKMSILGILVFIGAVIALASVFLNWGIMSFLGYTIPGTEIAGLDIAREEGANFLMLLVWVVIALAVIAIVLAIMEFLGKGMAASRAVILIMGILIIVLSYLAFVGASNFVDEMSSGLVQFKMQFGIYVAFIGGAIITLAAILGMAKALPE